MLPSRPRAVFAFVALALVALPLVGSPALFDPDEGLHAAIAQEMIERGTLVTPTFLGEPFYDKPILFFWTEAASLGVFGMTETAVRIPPLLFGLLSMLAVAALGSGAFGETAGLVAGICYGTLALPLGVSEIAVHDVALPPFICAASLALLKIERRRGTGWWTIVAGTALGLSVLTKGLVGVAFTGLFAVCLAVARPAAAVRIGIALAVALFIAGLIGAPWYLAMERAHPGYIHYYLIDRHVLGYLTPTQQHAGRGWWYYVPILFAGALPWTAYLIGAVTRARVKPLMTVVWAWLATGFLFLTFAHSKLDTYALPLFIPLALIVGEYVENAVAGSRRDRLFGALFAIHASVLAAVPAAALAMVSAHFGTRIALPFWVAALAAGGCVAWTAWAAAHDHRAFPMLRAFGGMTVISVAAVVLLAVPRAADWMTQRGIAAVLNQSGALPPSVSIVDERVGSLVFYLAPQLRHQATPGTFPDTSLVDAYERARVGPASAIVAVRDDQLAKFVALFAHPPAGATKAGTFTLYRAGDLRRVIRRFP